MPDLKQLKTWSPKGGLLVLDDLMVEGGNDKEVLDLFTKHSHHRNITVVCLRQDMFLPGKYFKSISRNSHHIVTFRNPRNQLGMRNVSSQAFPQKWQEVMNVYRKTTERPFLFLSGPAPTFDAFCRLLVKQSLEGIKDNVNYYRPRRRKR